MKRETMIYAGIGAVILAAAYFMSKSVASNVTVAPTVPSGPDTSTNPTNVQAPPAPTMAGRYGVYIPPASPPTNTVTPLPGATGIIHTNIPY